MKKITIFILIGVALLILSWAFFYWANTPLSPTPSPSISSSAVLSEIQGVVQIKNPGAGDFSAAQNGVILEVGGQVRTGTDGKVRVDFATGTIVRVGSSSIFSLESNLPISEDGLFTRLKMEAGKLFVILHGGALEVDTPSGLASVRGSYMSVRYDPVTNFAHITCLEGNCAGEGIPFTTGQTLSLHFNPVTGQFDAPVAGIMTSADFQDWVRENPEAIQVLNAAYATVTAISPLLATPTLGQGLTSTPTQTTTPTATLITTLTPIPSLTPIRTAAPTVNPNVSVIKSCGVMADKVIQVTGVAEQTSDTSFALRFLSFNSGTDTVLVSTASPTGGSDYYIVLKSEAIFWNTIDTTLNGIKVNVSQPFTLPDGTIIPSGLNTMNGTTARQYFTALGSGAADRNRRQNEVFLGFKSGILGTTIFQRITLYNNYSGSIFTDLTPTQVLSSACIFNNVANGKVKLTILP